MKKSLLSFFIVCSAYDIFAQVDCPNNMDSSKYVLDILSYTKSEFIVWLTINVKVADKKIEKIVISTLELSQLLGTNLHTDTTFVDSVERVLQNNKSLPSTFQVENYKVSANAYARVSKCSPCEVYKKYFNEIGIPYEKKFSHEEFRAAMAYLIDNYALITSDHFSTISVQRKPRCYWKKVKKTRKY